MVVGEGFEPSKSMTADLQSAPFGRSGTPPRNSWILLLILTTYILTAYFSTLNVLTKFFISLAAWLVAVSGAHHIK